MQRDGKPSDAPFPGLFDAIDEVVKNRLARKDPDLKISDTRKLLDFPVEDGELDFEVFAGEMLKTKFGIALTEEQDETFWKAVLNPERAFVTSFPTLGQAKERMLEQLKILKPEGATPRG